DAPPAHFRLKIEGFSSLSSSLERYESCEFDAGGYKWKLAFYPNGNKKKDGEEDHISLYLVLKETSVNLKKDILYMEVQEMSRFHALKSESGFDKFLSHKNFNDPSNGYLMNDTCVFGAEVFVINTTTKGQCLSMTAQDTIPNKLKPVPLKYTWKIENFSDLVDKCYYSDKFATGGHDWNIELYPKGSNEGKRSYLSVYLCLATNAETLVPAGRGVVVDQLNGNHTEQSGTASFIASSRIWGRHCLLNLSSLNTSTGYLLDDVCILEVEVSILGSTTNWD
ncbi:hypothetical protein AQUCO_00600340v1, partial [Aquilegia coerulea]